MSALTNTKPRHKETQRDVRRRGGLVGVRTPIDAESRVPIRRLNVQTGYPVIPVIDFGLQLQLRGILFVHSLQYDAVESYGASHTGRTTGNEPDN